MLHSPTPRNTPSHNTLDAFDRGDYLTAARQLSPDCWQHWASRAALGATANVTDALVGFDDPGAQFFAGVAAWMERDDERAIALLRKAQGEHARRLLDLIERRPLTVLTQLPWNRSGSWDVLGELRDDAFRVLNVSFHRDDIANQPYADVHQFVDSDSSPAFYLTEMLEWHLIPPNIRELGCPIIGHSSDYDVHIQVVAPWLSVFDELLVLDSAQWRDIAAMAPHARVSVFPKVFGVPRSVPDLTSANRTIDVFLSGTVAHPYHPDKDKLVLQLLELDEINLRIVNGFDAPANYYRSLADAKICANHLRHAGALPTRALEGLAMGCVVTLQEENVLHLFFDRDAGVVPYGQRSGRLVDVVRTILRDPTGYLAAAERGAQLARQEFNLARVASQYLRFATVIAARPRVRHTRDTSLLVQKRATIQKGWLPSYQFGGPLLTRWANASVERLEREYQIEPSARVLNDIARERLFAAYHRPNPQTWLPDVLAPLAEAISAFPDVLVPRFNFVRICLHFGGDADVRRALDLLDETLAAPPASWSIDPLDDVLSWDFCPAFFNYRRYLDTVTAILGGSGATASALMETILASLYYYRGRYAGRLPGSIDEIEYAARACTLDPEFAEYALYYCRLLIDRGRASDLREAAESLDELANRSARLLEIADLARQLPQELQGRWYEELCARAERFWAAVEMRENLPEPVLQPFDQDDLRGFALR